MEAVQAVCQWLVVLYLVYLMLYHMYRNRVRKQGDWAELFIEDLLCIMVIGFVAAMLYGAGCFTKIIGGE